MSAPGTSKPYRDHAWVYAAVTAIARNVAQVPFKLWLDDETELPESDPLYQLFKRPNPLLTGYELFYATECYLQLTGNCLWVPVPGSMPGSIADIWIFSGNEIKPIVSSNSNEFTGWEVRRGKMTERFAYDEALHFRYFNPYDCIMGLAPLAAARLAVDQSWWAQKYNEAFFQNFAEPGVIISFPGDYNAKVMQASKESWDQRHQGFNKVKKTAILWGGATLTELGATKRDMEFIQQMKWGREEVLAVFHVPPVEVMLVEFVSSRVEAQKAQRRLFGEEVIAPELKMIEDKLAILLAMLGRPEVRGWFDTTEVSILQESYGEKIDQAKKLFDMMIPINAIIEKLDLGFQDLPWGDQAYVPGTLVSVSTLTNPAGPLPQPEDEEPPPEPEEESLALSPSRPQPVGVAGPRARKLKRVLYELRNDLLKAKDGLGTVDWQKLTLRLQFLVPDATAMSRRLQEWSERATKDEIRVAYSKLKNHVTKIASPEELARYPRLTSEQPELLEKTERLEKSEKLEKPENPEKPNLREPVVPAPQWSFEITDFDTIWHSYESQILALELSMERVLVRYFNEWERELLKHLDSLKQVSSLTTRDGWEFDAYNEKMVWVTTPVLEATMTQMGSCKLAMSKSVPIKTTHIPQAKADRSLAIKETKELVKLLGGQITDNNHNTDILVGKNAVEVKAITARKNDRVINMSPATKAAKLEYLQANGLKGHTVVIDLREGKKVYYYSEGIGSRNLAQMKIVSEEELKRLIVTTANITAKEVEVAKEVTQVQIKDAAVNKGYRDSLAAAKKYVADLPSAYGGNAEWFAGMKKFLLKEGYLETDITEFKEAVGSWLSSSSSVGGQKISRSVARFIGRDPDKEWTPVSIQATSYFLREIDTEKMRGMLGAQKALSEEYYLRFMNKGGTVYRKTGSVSREKSLVGLNSVSSWSTKSNVSEKFKGVLIADKIDRTSVFTILPGYEKEVLVIHPKPYTDLRGSAIKRGLSGKYKDYDLVILDAVLEDADWLPSKRKKK